MKKLVYLFLSILFFTSCSEDDHNNLNSNASQEVTFGITKKNQSNNTNGEILTPAKIVLTLKDTTADTLVYNKKVLDLFDFNGQYLTQNVTLTVGEYAIEDYFVTDADNKVIYASPKESSELSQYVNNPLPLNFSVTLNEVTQVLPEVLVVSDEYTPDQFGYASFGFNIVEITKEQFSIVAFDQSNDITNFNLVIQSNDEELFNQNLEAKTNLVDIASNYDSFKLIVSKEGYETQTFNYTKEELKAFIDENNLKVFLKQNFTSEFVFETNITTDLYTFNTTIDYENGVIQKRLPSFIDLTNLNLKFTLPENYTISPSPNSITDYSEPISFTINSDTESYTFVTDFVYMTDTFYVSTGSEANASKWFGGDDRNTPQVSIPFNRNVGTGQSVTLEKDLELFVFSIYLSSSFKYDSTDEHYNKDVDLKLNIRNSKGEIIKSASTKVPSDFNGGRVDFSIPNTFLEAHETYIFTWHVINGELLGVNSGSLATIEEKSNSIFNGQSYSGQSEITKNTSIEDWSTWYTHGWFFNFEIKGKE